MERINVTKTFLPPLKDYEGYLEKIWAEGILTNQGSFLVEFEKEIQDILQVANFHFVTNGTIALQVALQALDVNEGEVITTPFSYVATTSTILWEKCTPIFVDIEPDTYCIDANKIEAAITKKTKAIMAVHVFGNPCDVEKITAIAQKHNLKVIYDAAHAFGVEYKDKSIFNYGDISTCSFHATKLFHTIEGGGIFVKDRAVSEKVELIKRFGHNGDNHYMLGINAKASELQAAMGLCNLKYVDSIIDERKKLSKLYDDSLSNKLTRPKPKKNTTHNYAYYPVAFEDEAQLLIALKTLNKENIYPRRYFYPSLNLLPYIKTKQKCPISEDIASRVLCLPLYTDLAHDDIARISRIINENIR